MEIGKSYNIEELFNFAEENKISVFCKTSFKGKLGPLYVEMSVNKKHIEFINEHFKVNFMSSDIIHVEPVENVGV